jgi:hypothetical protein
VKPVVREQKFDQSPEGGETKNNIAAFGALGTALSFTPGCTGGHNCQDPSDLVFQPPHKARDKNFFVTVFVTI